MIKNLIFVFILGAMIGVLIWLPIFSKKIMGILCIIAYAYISIIYALIPLIALLVIYSLSKRLLLRKIRGKNGNVNREN